MKYLSLNPASTPAKTFCQSVLDGIICADQGKTVDHCQVKTLYKNLKIKTLRLMECRRKKR